MHVESRQPGETNYNNKVDDDKQRSGRHLCYDMLNIPFSRLTEPEGGDLTFCSSNN